MRIFNKYAYMGAIALVGAVGFTACSSEDDLTAPQNPTFDGESVKTQFAINIPYAGGKDTRMTDQNTQDAGNFLGMKELRLISFDGEPSTGVLKNIITTLGTITNSELSASKSSKIYSNVNVPVQTDHFLFYAQAIGGTVGGDENGSFINGAIEPKIDGVSGINDINFQLVKTNNGAVTSDSEASLLLEVLNAVDADAVWKGTLDTDLSTLRTSLQNLKAGSANNIKLALQNLYNAVEKWATGTAGDNKTAALAIRNAITAAAYGGNSTQVFSLKSPGTSSPYELVTTLTFPNNLDLPDGAVKMQYANSDFSYETSAGNLTGLAGFDYTKVCYPAALYYFVNTDIATSNQSLQNTEWPTTTSDWISKTEAPWLISGNSWGTEVTASTQSIALKENINYGVASLELSVKCADGSLPDNGGAGTPNYIPVASTGFPVTGLLIGGQPAQIGWDFLPKASTSFDLTVYDNDIHDVYAKENASAGMNYTLLMPNKQTTAAKVNFAIELENNTGHEFRGQDGVVPVGGKFYLVGTLDPANPKTPAPSGVTDVFMSDYQTVATVTITSLENAYNTIPDLRATQMELGLSVDLAWKEGFVFDVEIGGN